MARESSMTILDENGGRAPKSNLIYNSRLGKWEIVAPSFDTEYKSDPVKIPTESDSGSVSTAPKNVDSKKKADKEYIEAEFNVLTGELKITPTEKSIRIKVNDTVKVEGLGQYLSGLYFVSAISRTLNKDSGYSHSLTLIKNGFGSSVKKAQSSEDTPRKEEVSNKSSEFKVGDSVKIVGDSAVYSNAHDGVKVPAWVKKKTHTIRQVNKDGTRVLLREINSWTYTKFIQKV